MIGRSRTRPAPLPAGRLSRILGIDPGITATGWGVVEDGRERPRVVACGTIRSHAGAPIGERLRGIYRGLRDVIDGSTPTVAAIEQVLVAKSARSAIILGQARGVALLAAAEAGLEIHEYLPMHVKQAATGYGHAEKGQVQKMLPHLLTLEVPCDSADAADALAIALCHLGRARVPGDAAAHRRISTRAAWTAAALARAAK